MLFWFELFVSLSINSEELHDWDLWETDLRISVSKGPPAAVSSVGPTLRQEEI